MSPETQDPLPEILLKSEILLETQDLLPRMLLRNEILLKRSPKLEMSQERQDLSLETWLKNRNAARSSIECEDVKNVVEY